MALLTGTLSAFPSSGTSDVYTSPFPLKPGMRARDMSGNEYVFCDFDGTVYYGILVQITDTFLASPLLGTASEAYPVGVVMCSKGTSDNAGWVQIYGLHTAVQTSAVSDTATTGLSGSALLSAQTSITTPSGTLCFVTDVSTAGTHIFGMWLSRTTQPDRVTDSSGPCTNTSVGPNAGSETSGTTWLNLNTVSCWLNYPYVTGNAYELAT